MRRVEDRLTVAGLLQKGLGDSEISRRTGVPRSTIRDWRQAPIQSDGPQSSCSRCGAEAHDFPRLPPASYAYLLGQYLGDGHLAHVHRGVWWLRVFMDRLHPTIAGYVAAAIRGVLPGPRVALLNPPDVRMTVVSCYSKQWPCLLPQHGPGHKHERPIVLTRWQRELVDQRPEDLVRGLLHSDGWRGTNRVVVSGKAYAYPRYQFTQVSDDIRRLFTDALDDLGIAWRPVGSRVISIARREAVAQLDAFVEPKR